MPPLPAPKSPSSLIKVTRWAMLSVGMVYGFTKNATLKRMEDERRAQEERERPAKEAAMKAEREKRNKEEMEYLRQQVNGGSGNGKENCTCPACRGKARLRGTPRDKDCSSS